MLEQDAIYKVETRRTPHMIKSFVRFTYRQANPKVSRNFLIAGGLNLALALVVTILEIRIIAAVIGVFCLLMGLFRHWIPITMMKGQDPDYIRGNKLTYIFTDQGIICKRNENVYLEVDDYSRVHNLYHDEWFYYLGANIEDLMILPKADFVIGDPALFGDFITEKAGIKCYWSPDTYKERKVKNAADSIIRQEKAREFAMQQAEEREKQFKELKKAIKDRKKK